MKRNLNVRPLPAYTPEPYQAYTLHNFRKIPQIGKLTEQQRFDIEVVGHVLPFKTNSYVLDELIDWNNIPNDPLFILTFPQKDMLFPEHYDEIAALIEKGADAAALKAAADRIRLQLNPHPAGQLKHNVPMLGEEKLYGVQHKYRQTVLFFPKQGQTCHAYCSFCFRWPQFVGMNEFKFASKEIELFKAYLQEHQEVSDVLFTGGDPMIMSTKHLAAYIEPLLSADLPNIRRIRIGTKALGFWPRRFTDDADSAELLKLFRKITAAGKHVAIMAHFSHPRELSTLSVREAIKKIRATGAEIRTQSPLLKHINDDPQLWADLWDRQVDLGCIPYYMFVARDTGAQHYFGLPLVRAWEIFREAYQRVSGLSRTVRGPSMSANPGKIQILGVSEVAGEKVIVMRFLQGRNPDWVHRPFFAQYSETAAWINELKPAFGEKSFFFESELEDFYRENLNTYDDESFE
ncbi:MAG: KamA family radical SAM protein [Gammaproteobacteria bacterium]